MRTKFIILLVLIVTWLSAVAYLNTNPRVILSRLLKKGDIPRGELVYEVDLFAFIPVGTATFKLEQETSYEGRRVLRLDGVAKTLNAISPFFTAEASLTSYVDATRLNPVFFTQKLSLKGTPPTMKEAFYDQEKGLMTVKGIARTIPADTQDPLSTMLNLRRMDFAKIHEFEMNINTNQRNYALTGVADKSEMSINSKSYKLVTVNADIRRRDKNPYHKSQVSMVLLRQKENIPILIKVVASGAMINVKLVEVR